MNFVNYLQRLVKYVPIKYNHQRIGLMFILVKESAQWQIYVSDSYWLWRKLKKILQNSKPKTSSGRDSITSERLKQLDISVAYPISIITNKSITSAVVPEFLKLSMVIPIYKSQSHDQFTNYRLIPLFPKMSKTLEKVIHKRLYTFLSRANILNDK